MKIGMQVVRCLCGTIPMKLTITGLTDTVITCGPWTFDRATGAEIDDDIGWGPPPKQTGSYLDLNNLRN